MIHGLVHGLIHESLKNTDNYLVCQLLSIYLYLGAVSCCLKFLICMAKRQTTVRIDPDLDKPLEVFMEKGKINLTQLFNIFLRQLLGLEEEPNLLDRVKTLEQKVGKIENKLDA